VIFPSIDRAGRSVKDIIDIETILRELGIGIIFLREGIDTSTPVGVLFRNVMASIAQFEGQLMYERMSKGKQRKASQGGYIGGWLPYGYERGETGIVIVPGEAKIVKQIFQWRTEGLSLRQICDQLNDRGVKTKRGCHWCVSTVRGMLMNRFYTGWVTFEHDYVRGLHQAIISDTLFYRG
jgi:DNA invertase Pin-like site-specific DNA recombinase